MIATETATARILELFCARTDVFPFQWYSPKRQVGGYSKACAERPPWSQGDCRYRQPDQSCGTCPRFKAIPVDRSVIQRHLDGTITIGSYQLAQDGVSVKWACLDFDDNGRTTETELQTAALTAYTSLEDMGMKVSLEASGGKGWRCHLWVFFDGLVSARKVRIILNAGLEQAQLGDFPFVERFPKQDSAPSGYGNLVKLPFGVHRKTGNRSQFLDPITLNPMSVNDALASVQLVDPTAVDFVLDMRGLTLPSGDVKVAAPASEFNHKPELMQEILRSCWYFRNVERGQAVAHYSVHYEDWWNIVLLGARFGEVGMRYIDEFSQKDSRYDGEYTKHMVSYIRLHGYHAPSCQRLRQGPGLLHCPHDPSKCKSPNAEGKRLFDGPEWQGLNVTRHPQRVVVNL